MKVWDIEWRIREAKELRRLMAKALETAQVDETIECLMKAQEHLDHILELLYAEQKGEVKLVELPA